MSIEEVIMPQMGESIAEGTLTRWLKSVGEHVDRDEPLFEISTDKVNTDIPSPASGVLEEIRVAEGETVPVQTVVAILNLATTAASSKSPAMASTPSESPTNGETEPEPVAMTSSTTSTAAPAPVESRTERALKRSSPLVRRIAREHGVRLEDIRGTGSSGRVTKHDILTFIQQREDAPTPSPVTDTAPAPSRSGSDVVVKPLSVIRQKIAEHMVLSKQTSAHVTTVFEVDMTQVAHLITANKATFLAANGVKLTYMPFIMKATIAALREYPIVNAALHDNEVHYFNRVHLGIAVALDDGLLVPVVRDADEKSIVGLSRSVSDLATRARGKKLRPEEVQGGTFTITNHGVFGSLFATPVINQPQAGILGVGSVTKRPVVLRDDAIAIRSMMYLGFSFDHRLIDGATADRFVSRIKASLEECAYSLS